MTIDTQDLIEQRPHLKNPLEIYAKWQRFHHETAELLPKMRTAITPQDSKAYPRETAEAITRLFLTVFELPQIDFQPLYQALENGEIDFMRLPQGEIPDASSLPLAGEELAGLLFLFARPYFMALRQTFTLDGNQWTNGRCPLCSAQASLASIVEGPSRRLHCSFCGTFGPYQFIGCPNCGTTETEKLNTILSDDEPGFRVITCDECLCYIKVLENQVLTEMGADLADLASLPLDIVAQNKGFNRLAPNPISLKKMP